MPVPAGADGDAPNRDVVEGVPKRLPPPVLAGAGCGVPKPNPAVLGAADGAPNPKIPPDGAAGGVVGPKPEAGAPKAGGAGVDEDPKPKDMLLLLFVSVVPIVEIAADMDVREAPVIAPLLSAGISLRE
jgi:hypothetical protein